MHCSVKNFDAFWIKDDLILTGESASKVERSVFAVLKALDTMEVTWSGRQKESKKKKLGKESKSK